MNTNLHKIAPIKINIAKIAIKIFLVLFLMNSVYIMFSTRFYSFCLILYFIFFAPLYQNVVQIFVSER